LCTRSFLKLEVFRNQKTNSRPCSLMLQGREFFPAVPPCLIPHQDISHPKVILSVKIPFRNPPSLKYTPSCPNPLNPPSFHPARLSLGNHESSSHHCAIRFNLEILYSALAILSNCLSRMFIRLDLSIRFRVMCMFFIYGIGYELLFLTNPIHFKLTMFHRCCCNSKKPKHP
jgi:hypothetical protein